MTKKEELLVKGKDFTGLLLKMQTKTIEIDPLYKKAFLDREEPPSSEYNPNTTTWD